MILEPHVIVLYVDDLAITSQFYQNLLGLKPEEASITFHSFKLSNGMHLGLKAKHSVEPPSDGKSGHGELAFTLADHKDVDALFATWQAQGVSMMCSPSQLSYAYTFVALDPDGHRLRVASLAMRTNKN